MEEIQYRVNTATQRHLEDHLVACGPQFVPPLGERVDIPSYAAKIASRAQRFEAWSDGTLVGLVAAYMDAGSPRAFVTSVSVLPACSGRGIASALLRACIAHARNARASEVTLEVGCRNSRAISLYETIGFRRGGGQGQQQTMTLQLVDRT